VRLPARSSALTYVQHHENAHKDERELGAHRILQVHDVRIYDLIFCFINERP
jgi:hypothetical protein